jgi:hypothetical protein
MAPTSTPLASPDRSSIDPAASGLIAACGGPISTTTNQAPELVRVLPDRVANRRLSLWSVRGYCAIEMVFGGTGMTVAELLNEANTKGTPPIDPDAVAYAIAGRSDVANHPPYFVFAAARPQDEDAIFLNLLLVLAGARVYDVEGAIRLVDFEVRTIGGKEVHVGTAEMLDQTEHQRGIPYLYQTEDVMFLVVTDDPAWAEEALAKLG